MSVDVPSRAGIFSRLGSRRVARNTVQVIADEQNAADRMPSFASASRGPWKESEAISRATVKPIPAIVPAPTTPAQPTGGRIRPRLSLVTSQAAPVVPTGLPTTYAIRMPSVTGEVKARESSPVLITIPA